MKQLANIRIDILFLDGKLLRGTAFYFASKQMGVDMKSVVDSSAECCVVDNQEQTMEYYSTIFNHSSMNWHRGVQEDEHIT